MAVSPSPTVFVIDDDAPVRDALSRLLRAHRFAVAAFASPKEFLEHYNPDTPGCLVLDLKMRGNGFGLQRTLREKGSSAPIIFLTGHGDIPQSVQAMKHGANDFLTKPVKMKTCLQPFVRRSRKTVYVDGSRPKFPKSARACPHSHRVSAKCSTISLLAN